MHTIRLPALLLVLTTTATMLAGCASNQDNTAATADASTGAAVDAEAEAVTVGIDVPFHPIFNYVMANSDTYFGDTPYEVEFKVLDATTQVPAFGRGDLDVITTVPSFMPTIKEQYGIDTRYFFPMARWTPGPQLLVAKDSPVTAIEDLAGKKVAIAPLASRFGAEQAAVAAATGGPIQDYFELSETDAAAQELTLGRVDGAFLEAPATAPLLAEGYRPVFTVAEAFEEDFGDPAVMNGGFIASEAFAEANPGFLQALVGATQDAWTKFQTDPAPVIADASEVSGLPPEQLELVAQVLNLAETTEEHKTVSQRDVDTWAEMFPLLETAGFIQDAPEDPASLFVRTPGQ